MIKPIPKERRSEHDEETLVAERVELYTARDVHSEHGPSVVLNGLGLAGIGGGSIERRWRVRKRDILRALALEEVDDETAIDEQAVRRVVAAFLDKLADPETGYTYAAGFGTLAIRTSTLAEVAAALRDGDDVETLRAAMADAKGDRP
jgi:hypothetical protein